MTPQELLKHIQSLTGEEVEDYLRKEGYTDDDFARMNRDTSTVIKCVTAKLETEEERDHYKMALSQAMNLLEIIKDSRGREIIVGGTDIRAENALELAECLREKARRRKDALDRMTTEAIAEGLYDRHLDCEVQPAEDNDGA